MTDLLEVRWHGRGGLGAVTSAELLARAAANEGKFAQSFPSFGPERRGAPVVAFLRISNEFIRTRTNIQTPDVVVVIDPRLLRVVDVTDGLKDGGLLIINSSKTPAALKAEFGYKWKIATVDATSIAQETIGVGIVNTTMLGAVVKITDMVKLDSLDEPLNHRFGNRAAANFEACKKAYKATVIG